MGVNAQVNLRPIVPADLVGRTRAYDTEVDGLVVRRWRLILGSWMVVIGRADGYTVKVSGPGGSWVGSTRTLALAEWAAFDTLASLGVKVRAS